MKVLLCPHSDAGYLYPALAVGRELAALGHAVYVLGRPSAADVVAVAGLEFISTSSPLSGFSVSRWFKDADTQFGNVVGTARAIGADALLTSALSHGSLLAAELLDIPAVVLGLATHLWTYRGGADAEPEAPAHRRWRAQICLEHYQQARERTGLPTRRDAHPETPLYGAGLLLRGAPMLEFPGGQLPSQVQHVGPCQWEPPVDPAELAALTHRLQSKQKALVYVHLGRTFGGEGLWPRLNAAFTGSEFQAVVEVGRSEQQQPEPDADVTVLSKPWMTALIRQAELVLSSGTSAPTLIAIEQRRPLLLAPAGSEQPLLTEACVRAGVARRLPTAPADCVQALRHARSDPELAARQRLLGKQLTDQDGARRAAELTLATVTGGAVELAS